MLPWSHISAWLIFLSGFLASFGGVAKLHPPWPAIVLMALVGFIVGAVFAMASARLCSGLLAKGRAGYLPLRLSVYLVLPILLLVLAVLTSTACAHFLALRFA